MTDLYVQNIENPLSKSARKKQIAGVLFTLLGIGLIIVATAVSYYAFIGVGILLALGTYLTVSYNKTIKSYEYGCNTNRLIFSVTTVIARTERKIEILLDDVVEYGDFDDLTVESDCIMCPNTNEVGVKALVFNLDGKKERVLFLPDDYMNAFLKETLKKEVVRNEYDRF